MSTADLLRDARAGDSAAFDTLTTPYRHELLVHNYRMLGTVEDAEDVLQETLLAAWRGLEGFQERASVRTWLYRIATNRCLNALRTIRRRPAKAWDMPIEPPPPTRLGEVPWIEPLPDAMVGGALPAPGPAASYEQHASISLAFVTALQLLPPRQVAVLILCDAVGFPASEVAEILDATTQSVHSALKRARTALRQRQCGVDDAPPPAAGSRAEEELVERFARAYEAADLDGIVALLTDDVFMAMPPIALEYVGRDLNARFLGMLFASGRRFTLRPTRVNGQPAFESYVRGDDGELRPNALVVLGLAGSRINALVRFEARHVGRSSGRAQPISGWLDQGKSIH
ncbi:MAG TPA: RNA polymerase subunit sigma-70 [Flexivirga sp.]|uniref:RNA polymerase subunit sigma-70 n=1 Tax=Flexivirga sp. TaxID=1962927 RepID=UPI002BB4EBDB|nr:RNA polymerase subunit sigma-70 [Flexivirga sp.]HWC23484.1 RNA polymerase subunit sigma-70 [Flexivirga sp.]